MMNAPEYLGFSIAFERPRTGPHGTSITGPVSVQEQIEAVQALKDYHMRWVREREQLRSMAQERVASTESVFDAILATLRAAE